MRFWFATLSRAPRAPLVVGSLVAAAYALLTLKFFWFPNAVPVAVGGVLGLGAACYYALRPQTLVAYQGREGRLRHAGATGDARPPSGVSPGCCSSRSAGAC